MLVRNNIIGLKEILINIRNSSILIASCTITIPIDPKQRDHLIQCKVLSAITTAFSPYIKGFIPIHCLSLSDDRDFFFQPSPHLSLNMYSHLLEYINTKVIIQNNSNRHVKLLKKQKLDTISKVFFKNCLSTQLEANTAEILPTKPYFKNRTGIIVTAPDPLFKTQIPNGIRVYSDKKVVKKISRLVDEFPSIWELSGFVQIPFERQMIVPLCNNE